MIILSWFSIRQNPQVTCEASTDNCKCLTIFVLWENGLIQKCQKALKTGYWKRNRRISIGRCFFLPSVGLLVKICNNNKISNNIFVFDFGWEVYFTAALSVEKRRLGTTLNVISSDWLVSVTRDLSRHFLREHLQITRKFQIHVTEKLIFLFFSNLSTVWCHSSLICWVQRLEGRFI